MLTDLITWATRWGVPRAALDELLLSTYQPPVTSGLSGELAVQQQIRAEAPALGALLGRNNAGATLSSIGCKCPRCGNAFDLEQRPVRYGWLNDSAKLNKVMKPGDLLGITPVTDPASGRTYGVFTMVEVKAPGFKGPRNDHERAQAKAILMVQSRHGIAGFASDVEHYRSMLYAARNKT